MFTMSEVRHLHKLSNKRSLVLLLSHMRAYTSLTGHVLGSHDEIEGYYEMHKGYFSWKSVYHAKLLYYSDHPVKKSARFLFDKVLHNEHYVSTDLVNKSDILPIFSIRKPEQTVKSIIRHYERIDPSHQYCNPEYSVRYYIERVNELASMSQKLKRGYLYFDAEAIKEDTQSLLLFLSDNMKLNEPLSPEYKKMKQTGSRFSGDSSEELFSGKIQKDNKQTDGNVELNEALLHDANVAYRSARDEIIKNADKSFILG